MPLFDFPLIEASPYTLLLIRLIMGSVMIYFGWPKIKDLRANAKDFEKMGFKPGMFWGTIIATLEFVGGIGIVLGIFVEWIALLMIGHMLTGTVWKITVVKKGFPNWSYDLLMASLALTLLTFGAGTFAFL